MVGMGKGSYQLLVVIWPRIRIPDHFSISVTIAECVTLGDLLAFLIHSLADFTLLGRMTRADKRTNPVHFGSRLAAGLIRKSLSDVNSQWRQEWEQMWVDCYMPVKHRLEVYGPRFIVDGRDSEWLAVAVTFDVCLQQMFLASCDGSVPLRQLNIRTQAQLDVLRDRPTNSEDRGEACDVLIMHCWE